MLVNQEETLDHMLLIPSHADVKRVFDRVRNVVAEPRTYIAPNIFNIGPQTGKETGYVSPKTFKEIRDRGYYVSVKPFSH